MCVCFLYGPSELEESEKYKGRSSRIPLLGTDPWPGGLGSEARASRGRAGAGEGSFEGTVTYGVWEGGVVLSSWDGRVARERECGIIRTVAESSPSTEPAHTGSAGAKDCPPT